MSPPPPPPLPPSPPPIEVRADSVSFDAKSRELEVEGNVRIDAPPFFLTSDKLAIRRSRYGVVLDGEGRLGFCPCAGTPLGLRFDGATVAPPGDVFVRSPRLEIYGVPVLWLPYFWLRSRGRIGLLPPEVAYRGEDGLRLGGGVHLPYRNHDTTNGLDLRASAYVEGGVAVGAALVTPASRTRLAWDRRGTDGLAVEAFGSTEDGALERARIAWDVDALRGGRGLLASSSLRAVAKPFDRATAEAALHAGGFTVGSRFLTVLERGGPLFESAASGPAVVLRNAGAFFETVAYDVTLEGGALRGARLSTMTFARSDASVAAYGHAGPFGASMAVRGASVVAAREGADTRGGAGVARFELTLPLARALGDAPVTPPRGGYDPWVHRVEPRVGVNAIASALPATPIPPAGRGAANVDGRAIAVETGVRNTLGRWAARTATTLDTAIGAVGGDFDAVPAARVGFGADAPLLGARLDYARVFAHSPRARAAFDREGAGGVDTEGGTARHGDAVSARVRVGRTQSLNATIDGAARAGIDPRAARVLVAPWSEPFGGYLVREGVTVGGDVRMPLTRHVVAAGGGDVDASRGVLLGARGALEFRDNCGCIVVRASGSQRLGREGIDVWLALELVPTTAR